MLRMVPQLLLSSEIGPFQYFFSRPSRILIPDPWISSNPVIFFHEKTCFFHEKSILAFKTVEIREYWELCVHILCRNSLKNIVVEKNLDMKKKNEKFKNPADRLESAKNFGKPDLYASSGYAQ